MTSAVLTAIIIAIATLVMQKTLSNLFYGVMIFLTKPLKKGNKVSIQQNGREVASGKVISVGLMHIKIKSYTKDVCIIPNSMMERLVITNSDYQEGMNRTNRIKLTYNSNIRKAKKAIMDILIDDVNIHNTAENTHIIVKPEEGGIVVEYNVRTDNIDQSFDECSEVAQKIIENFKTEDDIEFA